MPAQVLNRIVVIAIAAFALACTAPDILLPWRPFSTFGYNATPDGRITGVFPGLPAAKAGLHFDDRIDISKITPHERRYLCILSPAARGTTITLPVITGSSTHNITLVAEPKPRTAADNVTDIVLIIEQCLFVIIAAALAYLRPSWLTWSFYLYAVGVSSNSILVFSHLSDSALPFYSAVMTVLLIFGSMSMIVFATLFPRTEPTKQTRSFLPFLGLVGVAWFTFDLMFGYAGVSIRRCAAARPLSNLLCE